MTAVVVAYATKMGATQGIAEAIGEELQRAGMAVTVTDAAELDSLDGYDAAVVGSAVYMGRWRSEALELLEHQAAHGSSKPIWLFQGGPFEQHVDQSTAATPRKVTILAETLGAAGPVTFGGRIEPATAKGFMARKMAAGVKAGDYRDFTQIRGWAQGIAAEVAIATV